MTEAQTALARRVVACKGWRWLPGTLRLRDTPPSRRDYLLREGRVPDGGDPWVYENWPVIPDVTDAATLGCLLALVREAWGYPTLTVYCAGDWWDVNSCNLPATRQASLSGLTEAEALVAALEAAP